MDDESCRDKFHVHGDNRRTNGNVPIGNSMFKEVKHAGVSDFHACS